MSDHGEIIPLISAAVLQTVQIFAAIFDKF